MSFFNKILILVLNKYLNACVGSYTVVGVSSSSQIVKRLHDVFGLPKVYMKVNKVTDWIKSVLAIGSSTSEMSMTTQDDGQVRRTTVDRGVGA